MAAVTVRGWASRDSPPDRVRLTLGLEAIAARAAEALEELARRSRILDAALDAAGADVLARRPSAVTLAPRYEYQQNRQVLRGQAAVRTLVVELRPGGELGELLRRAVAEADARVQHLAWEVDEDAAVHAEVRAAAARDARARAEAYAGALGLRLGGVEWLAEPGLSGGESEGGSRRRREAGEHMEVMAAASPPDSGAGGVEAQVVPDLAPEPVRVSAAVEARFVLLAAGGG